MAKKKKVHKPTASDSSNRFSPTMGGLRRSQSSSKEGQAYLMARAKRKTREDTGRSIAKGKGNQGKSYTSRNLMGEGKVTDVWSRAGQVWHKTKK